MMRSLVFLLGLLLVAATSPLRVHAQPALGVDVEAATRQLASEMRCPVCQGVSIQDSPTELAQEMKGVIRQKLEEGRTPQEVKDFFVERYGEWILLQPEARGFNLLVYILPVIGLLIGGGFVFTTVRRWTQPPTSETALPGAATERRGRPAED
jgi:cytochrome c-type biogenesis protein CcmH